MGENLEYQRRAWGLDQSIRTTADDWGRDNTFDERTSSSWDRFQGDEATSIGWGGRLDATLEDVEGRGMDDALRQLKAAHHTTPANKALGSERDQQVHHQLRLTHRQAARQLEVATLANDNKTIQLLGSYGVNGPAPAPVELATTRAVPPGPLLAPHQLAAARVTAQKQLAEAEENAASGLKSGELSQKEADGLVLESTMKLERIKKELDRACDAEPLFQDEWGELATNTVWANQRQNRREQAMEIHWEEGSGRYTLISVWNVRIRIVLLDTKSWC